jgi:hypothetical protein
MCPMGRYGRNWEGFGIWTFCAGGGCASAAAPVQGSAVTGGEVAITRLTPSAAAVATDTDAIRGRGDMSYLSSGRTSHRRQQSADVTIVIRVTFVISDLPIGTHL